jgi:hypothetical protein
MKGYIKQMKSVEELGHFLKVHGVNIKRMRFELTRKQNIILWFSSEQSYNLPTFKA